MPQDRNWLLTHLADCANSLVALTQTAGKYPGEPEHLIAVRDAAFIVQETLHSLGVPHTLASHADWQAAIGTTRG